MRNRFGLIPLLSTFAFVGACSSGPKPVTGPVPSAVVPAPLSQADWTSAQAQTIRPMDQLSVSVLREPDLSFNTITVDEQGGFMMPLIGRVDATGMTASDVAEQIRSRLAANFLVNPVVSVNVVDYASHVVTVEGSVDDPGIFQFQPGTTLLGALALANGPTKTVANLKEVAIFRQFGDETRVAVYDIKQIRGGTLGDPQIEPGDRVVVGFSSLGEGMENFLRTVPLIGLFTRF